MRIRLVPLALVCLAALPAVARSADDQDKKPAQPTVIVRLKSFEGVVSDLKYLAALAGREDEVKNFEGILRARIGGEKGLKGFDLKRPVGLYGTPGPNGLDSTVVLMVPLADEKEALGLLENLELKYEKGEDG